MNKAPGMMHTTAGGTTTTSVTAGSVKLSVPIIKFDECCTNHGDIEAMNGVSTIACHNEDHYLTYNHIDSGTTAGGAAAAGGAVITSGPGGITKCVCNSHETDVDCSNIGISNCGDLGHVNCGSGLK